jgi:hypothetical protein
MVRSVLMATTLCIGVSVSAMSGAYAQPNLVPCAEENGFCRVPYPTRVFYGVPGRNTALDVSGRGIPCSNEFFGDPAPGVLKHCAYLARGVDDPNDEDDIPSWRTCARENGFCNFRGHKRVRYGAQGRFVEGIYRNGVDCDNETFGGDPAPGVRKFCQILD